MAEKLTDRTIFSGTVDKDNDLIHLVDVSDISQDPAGSSFSCVPKKFINSYISSGSETEGQTLYYDATTGKFLNTSNVHIDDSNNFVGVGITSALAAKLHVKSASGTALQVDGSSITGIFKVENGGNFTLGTPDAYIRQINTPAANNLQIRALSIELDTYSGGDIYIRSSDFVEITSTSYISIVGGTFGTTITNKLNINGGLNVTSTTEGFLPPRMTTAQRDLISTPAEGLVIYNTTTQVLNFYNGATWGAV